MIELNEICPKCQGTGMHQGLSCLKCSGLGYLEKSGLVLIPPVFWSAEVFECIDAAEYNNLTDNQKEAIKIILSLSMVNLTEGLKSKTALYNYFSEGTTTRTNLINLLGE